MKSSGEILTSIAARKPLTPARAATGMEEEDRRTRPLRVKLDSVCPARSQKISKTGAEPSATRRQL